MKKVLTSLKIAAGVVVTTLYAGHVSADTQYKSAMFDFSEAQFSEKLSAASVSGSAVLYCQSEISVEGKAERTHCYDQQGESELVSNVESLLGEMPFSAAEVDGQSVPVRMSYRVGLSRDNESLRVALIPNLGSVQKQYGRDYIAPQERLDVSNWYERYSNASWVNGEAFLGHGIMARVSATVNEEGKPELVREMETERAFKRDVKIVRNAVKKSRFIPGFVAGKPVSMGYLAAVNYGDRREAVSVR